MKDRLWKTRQQRMEWEGKEVSIRLPPTLPVPKKKTKPFNYSIIYPSITETSIRILEGLNLHEHQHKFILNAYLLAEDEEHGPKVLHQNADKRKAQFEGFLVILSQVLAPHVIHRFKSIAHALAKDATSRQTRSLPNPNHFAYKMALNPMENTSSEEALRLANVLSHSMSKLSMITSNEYLITLRWRHAMIEFMQAWEDLRSKVNIKKSDIQDDMIAILEESQTFGTELQFDVFWRRASHWYTLSLFLGPHCWFLLPEHIFFEDEAITSPKTGLLFTT